MKRLLLAAAGAFLMSGTASAQVLLQDTFNSENTGLSALNYSGFANWTVSGKVDLVANGDYGISCNTGSCIDLSGSDGPGGLTSNPFAFGAGDVLRISGYISGNQRNSLSDNLDFGITFGGGAIIGDYSYSGDISDGGTINAAVPSFFGSTTIAGASGFTLWTFEFTALSAGTATYFIGAPDATNQGPILDDVTVERVVSQSVVPEPSTYAMLAFGLGAIAFAGRRRRA